jgi:chromosome partitioning protein
MLTLAIVNGKGGTGKTTLAVQFAVRSSLDHPRTALVDLDPQRSLHEWFDRRGKSESPSIFTGSEIAADAVEALSLNGYDVAILDGPPAFLTVIQEMIEAADVTIIPVKPGLFDLSATTGIIQFARDARKPHLIVLNDVHGREKAASIARQILEDSDVPVAATEIAHRAAYMTSVANGRSVVDPGNRDHAAADEIERLWGEVKALAAKAKRKAKRSAYG